LAGADVPRGALFARVVAGFAVAASTFFAFGRSVI
jgi:hypothetical protein